MVLDDLFSRRLILLSGKGGVGKSVVGASLALAAVRRGLRAILVEVQAPLEAARYLGFPPGGATVREVQPGLSLVNLDPDSVMHEYVREAVKVDLLARKILDSPVYHRFYGAAPGLPELMMMGKIMVLTEQQRHRRRGHEYDVVIVDAPATGHGLSFLRVPQQASEAIPVGPVGNNARRILALLRDPRRTALVVVAIPEEMAVVEAVEFTRSAKEELGITPRALVLNACHERRFTQAQEAEVLRLTSEGAEGSLGPGVPLGAALAAARRHLRRLKLTRFYQSRLRRALSLPLVSLPYLFEEAIDAEGLRLLAERLEAA